MDISCVFSSDKNQQPANITGEHASLHTMQFNFHLYMQGMFDSMSDTQQ